MENPTNHTELLFFFGLCNIFRRLVSNSSRTTAPLNQNLKKDQSKTFDRLTVDEKQVIESLKELVKHSLILAMPRASGHYTVNAYACIKQHGCVFLQKYPDKYARPIAYWSRTLRESERDWLQLTSSA